MSERVDFLDLLADAVAERVAAKLADRSPRLLSVKEAAEYLGRTPDAIRKLESLGELNAIRAGRRVQFTREDLDAWIKRNRSAA